MKKIEIRNLGPITEGKIILNSFNVITGKQSSGKSTIAKSLYFFLDLKNTLGRLAFECHHPGVFGDGNGDSLNKRFKLYLRFEFEEIFDVKNSAVREGTFLRMDYTDDVYVQVTFNKSLVITYCNKLRDFITYLERKNGNSLERSFNDSLQKEIDTFLGIDYSPVYIPAGRSLMTVLGNQFELFFSTLSDDNKSLIDLCTRSYLMNVMRIKPLFGKGLSKLWKNQYRNGILEKAKPYLEKVINGEYFYSNGEEYLRLNDGQKVSVNMASSGQQEALWIYNILLYYTHSATKKFFIIEEPETNLFPESQQYMTRFLGLIANHGNPMLINTHSPYVLGELNNMIYAGTISGREKKKKTFDVIEKECQLKFESIRALFVENGLLSDCLDYEINQIDNTRLDAISGVINEEYDKLLKIERGK